MLNFEKISYVKRFPPKLIRNFVFHVIHYLYTFRGSMTEKDTERN